MVRAGHSNRHLANAFRVRTVADFDRPAARRKSKDAAIACQRCRARKIKCVTTESLSCLPCRRVHTECKWDSTTRKKGPKAYNIQPPSEDCQNDTVERNRDRSTLNTKEPNRLTPNQQSRVGLPSQTLFMTSPQSVNQAPPTGQIEADTYNDFEISNYCTAVPGSDPAPGFFAFLGQENGNNTHNDSILGDLQSGQAWADLQDFAVGLEFMGENDVDLSVDSQHQNTSPTMRRPTQLSRAIRLQYYRQFGPTAANPGRRKLSIKVRLGDLEENNGGFASTASDSPNSRCDALSTRSTISNNSKIFDSSGSPRHDMIPYILDTFFGHFSGHFPFFHPDILGGHVAAGEASSFLLNAIAALTVRFCKTDSQLESLHEQCEHPWQRGRVFLRAAKEQLVHLISIPEPEVVAGLIILSWAEFADQNETGLWMYLGMAIRMAQDLGMHRASDNNIDPATNFHDLARPTPNSKNVLTDEQSEIHQQKARLVMFWSVFIMDVCVSLETGRPTSIRRNEIEVPVPTAEDMKIAQLNFSDTVTARDEVFPETVKFMIHFAEAVELLNSRTPRQPTDEALRAAQISRIKEDLLQSYYSMPPKLSFTAENYKEVFHFGQSGPFITLHLYFYTFVSLLSHTKSKVPVRDNIITPVESRIQEEMAMITVHKTVQILSIVEIINNTGLISTPFINHCLFIVASKLLEDMRGRKAKDLPNPSALSANEHGGVVSLNCLHSIATHADYLLLRQKLKYQGEYFGAINSVIANLDERAKGLIDYGSNGDEGEDISRVVDIGDPGIINRYTIPE